MALVGERARLLPAGGPVTPPRVYDVHSVAPSIPESHVSSYMGDGVYYPSCDPAGPLYRQAYGAPELPDRTDGCNRVSIHDITSSPKTPMGRARAPTDSSASMSDAPPRQLTSQFLATPDRSAPTTLASTARVNADVSGSFATAATASASRPAIAPINEPVRTVLLLGAPGSGKSTVAKHYASAETPPRSTSTPLRGGQPNTSRSDLGSGIARWTIVHEGQRPFAMPALRGITRLVECTVQRDAATTIQLPVVDAVVVMCEPHDVQAQNPAGVNHVCSMFTALTQAFSPPEGPDTLRLDDHATAGRRRQHTVNLLRHPEQPALAPPVFLVVNKMDVAGSLDAGFVDDVATNAGVADTLYVDAFDFESVAASIIVASRAADAFRLATHIASNGGVVSRPPPPANLSYFSHLLHAERKPKRRGKK